MSFRPAMEETDEKIFEFAYRMALDDAVGQAAYMSSGKNSKTKLRDCHDARKVVEDYIMGIFDESYQPDFTTTAHAVVEAFRKYSTEKGDGKFTFGNAQKLINMTAKYMFMSTYGRPELRERFLQCHCPMDSIVLKKVAEEAGRARMQGETGGALLKFATTYVKERPRKHDWIPLESIKWSRLTEERGCYQCFQDAVRELARRKGVLPIEYDFFTWE